MIIHDVEQNTDEWFRARLGIPTASSFDKIVTSKGERSKQDSKYIDKLLAEYLSGEPLGDGFDTYWMRRGSELEPEAREEYEFITGGAVQRIGFCTLDDGSAGYSPDGFAGDDGLLEIKCPAPETMLDYYRKGFPTCYKQQCQGGLWITGRPWLDFYAYHPKMKPFLVRIERDEVYINQLFSAVSAFNIELEKQKKEMDIWKV